MPEYFFTESTEGSPQKHKLFLTKFKFTAELVEDAHHALALTMSGQIHLNVPKNVHNYTRSVNRTPLTESTVLFTLVCVIAIIKFN